MFRQLDERIIRYVKLLLRNDRSRGEVCVRIDRGPAGPGRQHPLRRGRRRDRECVAIAEQHKGSGAVEQPRGGQDDAFEHRLRIGRRFADDAKDLGCGGLPLPRLRVPLPRLGEFPVTLGERGEQSLARRFGRLSRGGGNSARQRYCLRLGGHRKGKGIRLPPPLKASLRPLPVRTDIVDKVATGGYSRRNSCSPPRNSAGDRSRSRGGRNRAAAFGVGGGARARPGPTDPAKA